MHAAKPQQTLLLHVKLTGKEVCVPVWGLSQVWPETRGSQFSPPTASQRSLGLLVMVRICGISNETRAKQDPQVHNEHRFVGRNTRKKSGRNIATHIIVANLVVCQHDGVCHLHRIDTVVQRVSAEPKVANGCLASGHGPALRVDGKVGSCGDLNAG